MYVPIHIWSVMLYQSAERRLTNYISYNNWLTMRLLLLFPIFSSSAISSRLGKWHDRMNECTVSCHVCWYPTKRSTALSVLLWPDPQVVIYCSLWRLLFVCKFIFSRCLISCRWITVLCAFTFGYVAMLSVYIQFINWSFWSLFYVNTKFIW